MAPVRSPRWFPRGLAPALALVCGAGATAHAGTLRIPDAGTDSLGSGIASMASVAEGRYVAIIETGSDSLYMFDTVSKEATSVAACGSSTITAVTGDTTERVYVGCANGTVSAWDFDANGAVQAGDALELASGEISALTVHLGDLYAFAQEDTGNASWTTVDISGTPSVLNDADNRIQSNGAVRRAVSGTTGIGITTSFGVERQAPLGSLGNGTAGGYDAIVDAQAAFIVTGDDGNLYQYNADATSGLFVLSLSGINGNASALGVLDDRLVVGTSDQELRYFDRSSAGIPTSAFRTLTPPAAGAFGDPVDIIEGEGVSVAGTTQGYLWYVTEGPWVEVDDPAEAISGASGTEFELTFESDTNGTARVRLNGTTPSNGTDLTGGFDVEAGEPVTLPYTMDGDFAEGANELRVVVTDSDGDVGQDILTVTKDDPPGKVSFVSISEFNDDPRVARGNQALRVVFRVLDEPDIEKYVVFFDDEAFSADDWDGCEDRSYCGPKYRKSGGPRSPLVITEWSGSTHEVELSPLENGTQYWIAVRAYDEGGKEGAMSAVLTGVPEAGRGPAELAGEQGGFQCGTTAASAGLFGLFAGLAAVAGRRRRLGLRAGMGAGLAAALMVGGVADAKDPDAKDQRKGTFQFRYGIFQVEDPNITRVMGDSGNDVLWMEVGPYILPQVEVSAGLGWFQEIGNPILESGGRSDDNVELTALPLSLNVNLRGDFWKNQPIVPTVGASVEMWNWRQDPYNGTSTLTGTKTGWSWNAGLQFLLDRLDPSAASKLRVRSGIDDTYLTVTYRDQTIGENATGLYYSGSVIGIGLKLDF